MDDVTIRKLIGKYLEGTCTEEESRLVEKWYRSFDRQSVHFTSLSERDQLKIKKIMHQRIRSTLLMGSTGHGPRIWYRYAAGVVIILSVLSLWLIRRPPGISSPQFIKVANTNKQMLRLDLPDSSTAWLYPGSTVSYPQRFGKQREVVLVGEAFFEVKRDPGSPFQVTSGGICTKVLGTSFRVRAEKNAPQATVTVLTGKVAVRRIHSKLQQGNQVSQDEVLLLPDEKATFSEAGLIREEVAADELNLWKKTSMTFDNKHLQEVLEELNNVFDVRITASDPKVGQYLLKADFTDMNLPDILELLENSLYLTYEIEGDRVYLKPFN